MAKNKGLWSAIHSALEEADGQTLADSTDAVMAVLINRGIIR